jgi:C-terminal processing protease CtpA/Prc
MEWTGLTTFVFSFGQKLPEAEGDLYKGKVVMLINEDAISSAEHTCLFFESATDVTFIGTPTAGANGDVTAMSCREIWSLVSPAKAFVTPMEDSCSE